MTELQLLREYKQTASELIDSLTKTCEVKDKLIEALEDRSRLLEERINHLDKCIDAMRGIVNAYMERTDND